MEDMSVSLLPIDHLSMPKAFQIHASYFNPSTTISRYLFDLLQSVDNDDDSIFLKIIIIKHLLPNETDTLFPKQNNSKTTCFCFVCTSSEALYQASKSLFSLLNMMFSSLDENGTWSQI